MATSEFIVKNVELKLLSIILYMECLEIIYLLNKRMPIVIVFRKDETLFICLLVGNV